MCHAVCMLEYRRCSKFIGRARVRAVGVRKCCARCVLDGAGQQVVLQLQFQAFTDAGKLQAVQYRPRGGLGEQRGQLKAMLHLRAVQG